MVTITVDARDLHRPGPIMALYNALNRVDKGDIIKIEAKDPDFVPDVTAWCERTGNEIISTETKGDIFLARIKKV